MSNHVNEQVIEASREYAFFHVCGQVTYREVGEEADYQPELKREIVTMLYRGSDKGINGMEYASLHNGLVEQLEKEQEEALKLKKRVLVIEKCDIMTIFPLGLFTQEKFEEGITLNRLNMDPDKKS